MQKRQVKQYINNETGEIFDKNRLVVEYEYVDDYYGDIKRSNDYIVRTFGNYFHLIYGELSSEEYQEQMIVRLLRLCCKIDYSNNIRNGLTSKYNFVATTENLMKLWKLSKRETLKTKKYLVEKELIFINEDKHISINEDIIKKGKIRVKKRINGEVKYKDVTRVFQDGFSQLYDGVKASQHKKLYLFIKILPHMNIHHNIICDNTHEKEIGKVRPITWTELGRRINLKELETKRLRAELWNLQINDSAAVGEFSTFSCGKCVVVNPNIYYKGNNREFLKGIGNLFSIKKNTNAA